MLLFLPCYFPFFCATCNCYCASWSLPSLVVGISSRIIHTHFINRTRQKIYFLLTQMWHCRISFFSVCVWKYCMRFSQLISYIVDIRMNAVVVVQNSAFYRKKTVWVVALIQKCASEAQNKWIQRNRADSIKGRYFFFIAQSIQNKLDYVFVTCAQNMNVAIRKIETVPLRCRLELPIWKQVTHSSLCNRQCNRWKPKKKQTRKSSSLFLNKVTIWQWLSMD